MEYNILNITLVVSFAFVSVALGVKWLGQALIEYRLAKLGLMMERLDQNKFNTLLREEEDDEE